MYVKIYVIAVMSLGVVAPIMIWAYFPASIDDHSQNVPLQNEIIGVPGSIPLGSADAQLTLLEWGDYQCTYCYRFHQNTLDTLKEQYVDTGIIRMVFYDFPLNGEDSFLASQASHCAADQGLYWTYHDTLYENWAGERTGWITPLSLYGFALDAGLDISEYNECINSGRHMEYVQELYAESQKIGIDATPSFVITNGSYSVKIVGNQPYAVFEATIQDMLR